MNFLKDLPGGRVVVEILRTNAMADGNSFKLYLQERETNVNKNNRKKIEKIKKRKQTSIDCKRDQNIGAYSRVLALALMWF